MLEHFKVRLPFSYIHCITFHTPSTGNLKFSKQFSDKHVLYMHTTFYIHYEVGLHRGDDLLSTPVFHRQLFVFD